MFGINEELKFVPVRAAILTVSDTRTLANDTSGDTLKQRLEDAGHIIADRKLLRDDAPAIKSAVEAWIADPSRNAPCPASAENNSPVGGIDTTASSARPR